MKPEPYKPPNKSLIRSQFSTIFSEADINRDGYDM